MEHLEKPKRTVYWTESDPNRRGKRQADESDIDIPPEAVEACREFDEELAATCEFDYVYLGAEVGCECRQTTKKKEKKVYVR